MKLVALQERSWREICTRDPLRVVRDWHYFPKWPMLESVVGGCCTATVPLELQICIVPPGRPSLEADGLHPPRPRPPQIVRKLEYSQVQARLRVHQTPNPPGLPWLCWFGCRVHTLVGNTSRSLIVLYSPPKIGTSGGASTTHLAALRF